MPSNQSFTPELITKNGRETLRVTVDAYKGRWLLSARVWYEPREGGDLRPGRDGFAIAVQKLPEIIAGLERLAAEARAAGLLTSA